MPDVSTQILDTANRLFAERGYDATSLQVIADEVGIRKPSLLYHFPSKDELRLAVLGRLMQHWNEVLPRLLEVATTGEDRFESLVGEVIGFFREDPMRARLLYREILDRPEELGEQLREFLSPWISLLATYIRSGQKTGLLRQDVDPEAFIVATIQMIVGGLATGSVFGGLVAEEDAPNRIITEIARMARASLFTHPE